MDGNKRQTENQSIRTTLNQTLNFNIKKQMGNPINVYIDHMDTEGFDLDVSKTLDSIHDLGPNSLKVLFEHLFGRMTAPAKEAVMDILWNSMNVREQHLFQTPSFDRRLSTEEILNNLAPSQTNSRRLPTRESSAGVRNENRMGLGIMNRNRMLSWPIEQDSNTQTAQTNSRFIQSASIMQHTNQESPTQEEGAESGGLETQILGILMDVVSRASERTPNASASNSSSSMRQSLQTWRENSRIRRERLRNSINEAAANRP